MKRYRLRDLDIDRVDHVDQGANQLSDIVLFKSHSEVPMDEIYEAIAKGLIDADVFTDTATGELLRDILPDATVNKVAAIVSAVSAETQKESDLDTKTVDLDALPEEAREIVTELQEQVAQLTKSLDETKASLEEAKSDEPPADPIEKALSELPEEVAKAFLADRERLAKAEEELKAQREAAEDAKYTDVAKQFSSVIEDASAFGPILRRLASSDQEAADAVIQAFTGAEARLEKSALFEEVGSIGVPTGGDAYEKATSIAKSMVEANPDLDLATARSRAFEADVDLYNQYLAEEAARKRG